MPYKGEQLKNSIKIQPQVFLNGFSDRQTKFDLKNLGYS